MASALEVQRAILDGSVAFGWAWDGKGKIDLEADPMRGYVRLHEDGYIEFEALDEDPLGEGRVLFENPAPPMLALSTRHGAALLLEVFPLAGGSLSMGGGKASVLQYRADSLVSGIDIHEISSGSLKFLTLRFHGFGGWAGMDSATSSAVTDAKGLVQSAKLELNPTTAETSKNGLHSTLVLTVDGYWEFVDFDRPAVTVHTGIDVEVSALRARSFQQLLEPLLNVQDLLNLLNTGFIASQPSPTGLLGIGKGETLLWTRRAMHTPSGAILRRGKDRPLISLADLGGVAGLARWSNLRQDHPVVVDTATSTYRNGPDTVETAIVRVASAIELWVASHKKKAAWPKGGNNYAEALALRVGKPFEAWVGPADKWAKYFSLYYNGTKHHTPTPMDPYAFRSFAVTGRWLLICALLDRAAGTKKPSQSILTSHRLEQTGEQMRAALTKL